MPRPRKRFGQHWLRDPQILNQILAAAELCDTDRVLEIGPGQGVLTKGLVPFTQAVVAVEVDRDLVRQLQQQFQASERFHLIEGDFLDVDLAAALADHPNFQSPNKVVANIPYYITGPILEKLLGQIRQPNPQPYDSIVLLVQKEVADRLYAEPGTKAFNGLSVRIQYLAECELICPVPAKAFKPAPKVDSAVVRLRPRTFPVQANNPKLLDTLVKQGFSQKRKMLRNNLKSLVDREQLTKIMETMAIDPQVRAEQLSLEKWVNLSNQIGTLHPAEPTA
ncbi:16S rRNA (adenine(1518)-N(6)/adenine(1519)-N(6))-dimethyltransferase RsmA [Leptolyngbyaceae cyanobacterium CCMR0082]|uniref:Ribosomal RNA small subunit methyltransferase A n=1 Tax=Adonisia turfae CCMR0082 TaxID=2304604 RepID=A0A6M0SEA9_9CYAN|nr:16S rRNA (adenine(1518)-N(6)/adenine(1519)-N(6))-dimethyltransferase RsmA [Adonisia turfae]NEZ66383.1 16S rRNA (adenine(1518)-N(6)/adenine(1519)-N(6))-dimethyltransferase RsmA [Adonisia turfae CCMR0082]